MYNIRKEKVLLLENINQTAVEMFKKAGFENIELLPSAIPEKELMEKISDVAVLGVRSRTWIKEPLLQKAKNLKAIGCFIVGVNKVDLQTTEKMGIPAFHGPFSSTRSVAELAIGFTLSLFRKIHDKNLGTHKGEWRKKVDGNEVRGKTMGILGFSNIGSQVGLMAEALGMNVIFYDVMNMLPLGNAVKKNSMEEVLKEADVVSIHVPSLPATQGMINKKTLSLMKDGSYLINTSRGDIVVDKDMCDALESGKLAGFATDVYSTEPKSPNEPLESPFIKYENALLTPHIGGSTKEAQTGIAREVTGKLLDYLLNGKTADAINFPKITLPPNEGTHRFMHIHENVPGMLGKINGIFEEKNINITSQFLNTSKNIGYVVTDIEGAESEEILSELQKIPHTIKCYFIL